MPGTNLQPQGSTRCGRCWWAWRWIAIAAFVGQPAAQAAPKTDIVILANGDRITGEVKGLEHGQLKLKTDAAGTIYIEWDKIAHLQTNQYLQVELQSGVRYYGQAPRLSDANALQVVSGAEGEAVDLRLADIVRIDPIERGHLIKRLDGYLTAGYNYTKSNSLQQFTFTGGLSSRAETYQWSLDGSSTVTQQQGNRDTSRYSIGGWLRQMLPDRWFVQEFGGFESNDELGLDLRTTGGAAFGRYLLQTSRQEWGAYAGLAYASEAFTDEPQRNSLEAVIGTQYGLFIYDHPEASVNATLNLLPSLTESGRYRVDGNVASRYEIVKDLFWEVSVYANYDSKPGKTAESNSDYGLTTSLGYSF